MGSPHYATTRPIRLPRAAAAFGLAWLALILPAGKAEAGLDTIGGDDRFRNPVAGGSAEHKPAPGGGQALAEVHNSAGERLSVTNGACERNLALAASKDLRLPDGWEIRCVGPGLDWNGASHWGVTCPYEDCPEGNGPYVSISNPTYYVVAHELCHANFGNDELMADACAAEHGASLASSPYS